VVDAAHGSASDVRAVGLVELKGRQRRDETVRGGAAGV